MFGSRGDEDDKKQQVGSTGCEASVHNLELAADAMICITL